MRSVISRAGPFRSASLVLLGILVGAGAMPTAAALNPSVTEAVTQTRAFSCTGPDFHPVDSSTTYTYSGLELQRTDSSTDPHQGFFMCNAVLPTRAVVTKVQFMIHDATTGGGLRYCGLYRNSITTRDGINAQELGAVPQSGVGAEPGYRNVSDATIKNATVDNGRFAYFLQCQLDRGYGAIGLIGAGVVYRITPGNG